MNRLSRTLLMLSLVLACPPLARSADDKTPATPYYPLVVGNTWDYKVGENRFSLKVARIEKVDKSKQDAARIEVTVNGKVASYEDVGVTPTALVRYSFEGKKYDAPVAFLKLPPKKGETWNVEARLEGQVLKGAFTILEEKEAVKVPAGAFSAVVVRSKGLEVNGVKVELTYYFAEQVGMVKQVYDIAGQKAVIELEKFEPGKK